MSVVAPSKPRRRSSALRALISILIIVVVVGGGVFWLNSRAKAATNSVATLTVFVQSVSVSHSGGAYAAATTGTLVQPGDSVKTDATGRASIQFPDGTFARLATGTEITLTTSHFSKAGNLQDATITQKLGRTLSNVQHLASGATYTVIGHSTSASVRGTKFEVVLNADGTLVIKLFDGTLEVTGRNHVTLVAGQQVTVDALGNVGTPGPILPDPSDPFTGEVNASKATSQGTTPGTEQDFVGLPLKDGQQQEYTYSFAGGGLLKAALGYQGSNMELRIQAPDGKAYAGSGPPPVVVVVDNAPAGIYKLQVTGISGLGAGEQAFVSVAALEPCTSANIDQNGAVRRGYTPQDLANAIQVSGLSNLNLTVVGDSIAGAIVTGSATYQGAAITGTIVLFTHGGVLEVVAVAATVFGTSIPAEQAVQQIGAAIGQDPGNIGPGFVVDRLFTCTGVVMMDGRVAK